MNGKQLKNSILQWAIQGKLVPQDPNDEPASVLLERIRAEKARLVKEGRIKKDKNESIIFRGEDNSHYEKFADGRVVCIDDETPFEVPQGWEWTRLRSLVYNHGQVTPNKSFCYIDIGSIDNKHQKLNPSENTINPVDAPSRARRIVELDDILYSTVRPYLHNMCIVDRQFSHMPIASTGFAVMACHKGILNRFLFLYLQSPDFDRYANDGDNAKGVAYPAINDDKLYKALIPVPPTEEQIRITDYLNKLFPLISRYEETQNKLDVLNTDIRTSLRKSFLQEAVQGRLVPQDTTDEPAMVMLERIRVEKKKLLKEGQLKRKDIVDSVIFKGEDNKYYEKVDGSVLDINDEIPFEIPQSWIWVRLQDICTYIHRGKSPNYSEIKKFPVIAQKCNQWEGFRFDKAQFVSPASVASYSEEQILQDRDLLWNSTGLGTLGRIGLYPSSENPYGFAVADSHVTVIRPLKEFVRPEYLHCYLSNPTVQNVIEDKASGSTKQKELATETVKRYLCPIPPVKEQDRIVDKVNTLIASTMRK